jgi:hypothetical protein
MTPPKIEVPAKGPNDSHESNAPEKVRVFLQKLHVARRKIARGEELTFHYGRDHFEGYIKPFGCKCVKCRVETVPRKLVEQTVMSD